MNVRILTSCSLLGLVFITARAEEPLGPDNFERLQRLIRPQPGESAWMDIPWEIDMHAARIKAAAEGKPIFVMSGGGATAIGPC